MEFLTSIKRTMANSDELFYKIDSDRSGTISASEFMLWWYAPSRFAY